jgi:hypothetical protein
MIHHPRWRMLATGVALAGLAGSSGCHYDACTGRGQEPCINDHQWADCYSGEGGGDSVNDCPDSRPYCVSLGGTGHSCNANPEPPPVPPGGRCLEETVLVASVDDKDLNAADLNGDGLDDLVFRQKNALLVALAAGQRKFAAPMVLAGDVSDARIGRFDQDELPDIVAETTSHSLEILLSPRSGGFSPAAPLFELQSAHLYGNADVDGDGIDDIFLLEADRTKTIRFSRDGYRTSVALSQAGTNNLQAEDLDRDGRADLVVVEGQRSTVFLATPSGTWTMAGTLAGWPTAAADFNGDGKIDIAMGLPSTGRIYLGLGDGRFGLAGAVSEAHRWAVADVDGDGDLDLAQLIPQTENSEILEILSGDGRGAFRPRTMSTLAWQVGPIAPGRIDRSGAQALLTATIDDVRVIDPACP